MAMASNEFILKPMIYPDPATDTNIPDQPSTEAIIGFLRFMVKVIFLKPDHI